MPVGSLCALGKLQLFDAPAEFWAAAPSANVRVFYPSERQKQMGVNRRLR
jgi:hypothetical protein